jgi:hypothetical protein
MTTIMPGVRIGGEVWFVLMSTVFPYETFTSGALNLLLRAFTGLLSHEERETEQIRYYGSERL